MIKIVFSLFLILAVALYPYAFPFPVTTGELTDYSLFLGWGRSNDLDVLVNVLLFLPLGFSLTSTFAGTKRRAWLGILTTVCAFSAGLSYMLEVLQIFIPHRFPSLVDVFANSSGGGAGFLCFHLYQRKNVRLNLFLYMVAAFLASILLQRSTGLRNWDTTFPLLIGNEKTGDRPWKGDIYQLYIADKAISETKVQQIVKQNNVSSSLADSLLVSYRFVMDTRQVHDETGLLPDLLWRGKVPTIQSPSDTLFSPDHWLETAGSALSLVERIRKSSQFTLGISVKTYDTTQAGPARIVSLSFDPNLRNFTLGQQQSDLIFRLRTPVTAASDGGNAALRVPGIFAHTNLQNLIITYDGAKLILYVNGVPQPTKFELSPGSAVFSPFIDSSLLASQFCQLLYYASVCIPLGIFVMLITEVVSGQIMKRTLLVSGGVVFACVSLEGLLVATSGKNWNTEGLLISIAMMFGTIVLWVWSRALRKGYVAIRSGPRLRFHQK